MVYREGPDAVSTPSPWKFFTVEELSCRHCGEMRMNHDFMEKVVRLRKFVGFALPITSGYRCPDHNEKVSKTGRSGPHTTGHAVDIQCTGAKMLLILDCARRMGEFTGFGFNQKGPHKDRFLHLDDLIEPEDKPRPWAWTY